jgi:hypothetical protein
MFYKNVVVVFYVFLLFYCCCKYIFFYHCTCTSTYLLLLYVVKTHSTRRGVFSITVMSKTQFTDFQILNVFTVVCNNILNIFFKILKKKPCIFKILSMIEHQNFKKSDFLLIQYLVPGTCSTCIIRSQVGSLVVLRSS